MQLGIVDQNEILIFSNFDALESKIQKLLDEPNLYNYLFSFCEKYHAIEMDEFTMVFKQISIAISEQLFYVFNLYKNFKDNTEEKFSIPNDFNIERRPTDPFILKEEAILSDLNYHRHEKATEFLKLIDRDRSLFFKKIDWSFFS